MTHVHVESAAHVADVADVADVVAVVGGSPLHVADVDAREARLRASRLAASLPRADTSEGRQLRRWLTQLLASERVVAAEEAARAVTVGTAPAEEELMPDTVARMELGSVAAAVLETPVARALFEEVTRDVAVSEADVAAYHARNPACFAAAIPTQGGWVRRAEGQPLDEARSAITAHLLAAARRREFRRWLDERVAALVDLAPGYEHPGDPRQPDNTHRH